MALVGTCASAISGVEYAFAVDGAPAVNVTCPPPGVQVRVEPSIDSCYGFPACSYRECLAWPRRAAHCLGALLVGTSTWAVVSVAAQQQPCRVCVLTIASLPFPAAAGYTVTSMCPSRDSAEFTCKAPACSRAGQVIDLVATPLCTNVLKCARITYTVDGAAATTFTCPSGPPVTIVPAIKAFGGNALCDYPGPAIVVNGAD